MGATSMWKGSILMTQYSIPCSVYRGGTSRGLFFLENNLPIDTEKKKEIFLSGIDAYNPSQVNGLGSGASHASKVVVISPSNKPEVHVEYTFYQVGIGSPITDDKGTCGNLMAAVGAFVVDEGLVEFDRLAKYVNITVYNTNVKMKLLIRVPLKEGKAQVRGDYLMPGLVTTGAKLSINILEPGGGTTGETAPLGKIHTLDVDGSEYEVSFIDVVNPFLHISSIALGINGTEQIEELSSNEKLLARLDLIRNLITVEIGFAKTVQEAKLKAPAIPKITFVAKPQDYITTSGEKVKATDVDIIAKMISMERLHRTFAGSGLFNLATATLLPGTVPNLLANREFSTEQKVRIGHPDGIAEVYVRLTDDRSDVESVGLDRTARRIMKGQLFIPNNQ